MYSIFTLPDDFLSREYTADEKNQFNKAINDAIENDKPALMEELTKKQKEKVDSWYDTSPYTKRQHDSVFGENVDRIVIPFEGKEDPISTYTYNDWQSRDDVGPHAKRVIAELQKKSYYTDDYHSGLAYHIDKPERKMKIGTILQKEKIADMEFSVKEGNNTVTRKLSNIYEMDPDRKGSRGNKSIVITRNKYDVAGMSTGRDWSSCMNMVDGCNRRYLPKDIFHGTMSAYYVMNDDHDIKRPLGRVNIKQFNGSSGDNIFRRETTKYGKFPREARDVVEKWTEENYKSNPGIYTKESSLYDDDGKNVIFERPEEIEDSHILKQAKNSARNIIDSTRKSMEDAGEKFGYDNYYMKELSDAGKANAYSMFNKIHDIKRDNKLIANSVIAGLVDHSNQNDGIYQTSENTSFATSDIDGHRFDEDDIHQHWAITKMEHTPNDIKNGIAMMSPEEINTHLASIHHAIKNTEHGDDNHEMLKSVHGMLIDNLITNHAADGRYHSHFALDNMLHHFTDSNNYDYYHSLTQNNRTLLDSKTHPVRFTSDPRLMHKLIDSDHLSEINDHWDWKNHHILAHIAEHADAKLANSVLSEHLLDEGKGRKQTFAYHLNDNKSGESIQHMIINNEGMMLKPDEEDSEKKDLISSIAQYTKFKSVYTRIKARTNTDLNHPDIHTALKQNENFKKTIYEAYSSIIGKSNSHIEPRQTVHNAYLKMLTKKQ
jgi:hypothetical protein